MGIITEIDGIRTFQTPSNGHHTDDKISTHTYFLNTLLGRFLVTREEADVAFFKTPTLRNVLVTAPYFHDGSMETLSDAVDHYNKGDGLKDPWLDDDIEPLALTENEIDDLVAFMASLTSPEYKEIGIKELARQRALARISRPQRDTARAFGPKPERPKAPSLTNDSSHP